MKDTKKGIENIKGNTDTKVALKDTLLGYAPYLIIIFFVVIIRIFIASPVKVNGNSMYPTLHDKDTMVLYKLVKHTKGFERFDIVVIDADGTNLIKRIIGLPGDKVKYQITEDDSGKKHGVLLINDVQVDEPFLDEEYKIQTCDEGFVFNLCEEEYIVPKGEYFAMGDNRGNSKDSRMLGSFDFKIIKGKTKLILFPFKRFGNVK